MSILGKLSVFGDHSTGLGPPSYIECQEIENAKTPPTLKPGDKNKKIVLNPTRTGDSF
jgi:hypothetical protein